MNKKKNLYISIILMAVLFLAIQIYGSVAEKKNKEALQAKENREWTEEERLEVSRFVFSGANVAKVEKIINEDSVELSILELKAEEQKKRNDAVALSLEDVDFTVLDFSVLEESSRHFTYKSSNTEYVRCVESEELRDSGWLEVAEGDVLILFIDKENNSHVIIYKNLNI